MILPLRFADARVALIAAAANQVVHACPVCFRIDDAATTSGVYAAVFVLGGVTAGVLGGFAAFAVRFVLRARRMTRAAPDVVS